MNITEIIENLENEFPPDFMKTKSAIKYIKEFVIPAVLKEVLPEETEWNHGVGVDNLAESIDRDECIKIFKQRAKQSFDINL